MENLGQIVDALIPLLAGIYAVMLERDVEKMQKLHEQGKGWVAHTLKICGPVLIIFGLVKIVLAFT